MGTRTKERRNSKESHVLRERKRKYIAKITSTLQVIENSLKWEMLQVLENEGSILGKKAFPLKIDLIMKK